MERHGWLALDAESNSDTHGCTRTYQQRHILHITSPTMAAVLPQKWYSEDTLTRIFNTPQTAVEETAISMRLGRTTWRALNVREEVGEVRRSETVTALYNVSVMYVDHL
jgi:hypothetical protein